VKRFYIVLGIVAVIGAALLVYAATKPEDRPALAQADVEALAATDTFPGYVSGSDSARVEVVEYADFECPHCARFAILQMPDIRTRLIATGRVRWRFRDFPLGFPWSTLSAHAAACAAEQGRFEAMHDQLFFRQREWGSSSANPQRLFRELARQTGVDVGRWDACMSAQRYLGRIEASRQEAIRRGASGTPTFFINGVKMEFGNPDRLVALVDSIEGRRTR
jgi:protein-disulfide isomerase